MELYEVVESCMVFLGVSHMAYFISASYSLSFGSVVQFVPLSPGDRNLSCSSLSLSIHFSSYNKCAAGIMNIKIITRK